MLQLKSLTVLMALLVGSMIVSPAFAAVTPSTQNVQNYAKSGDFVTLMGQGIDPDDDSLTISWVQVRGEQVELTPSNTVAEPTFKAPMVENGRVKVLTFELTVEDAYGEIDTDLVKVTILPRNQQPTADAGSDQTVEKGDEVTLDGSGSDPEGDALRYNWSQITGPKIQLDDPSSQTPSFDTSSVTRGSAIFTFQLIVFDGFGGMAKDTMTVKMTAAKPSLISVSAGRDQIVDEGDTVQLEGTCDDKLDREQNYSWVQTLGPFVELSSNADSDLTFVAPEISNSKIVPTAFRFTCQAEDGGSATDVVIVRVRPVNDGPMADAGPDKNSISNRFVYLAGTGSDPDGDIIKYSWSQVGGDDVVIAYQTKGDARFKAPEVFGGASTELTFELTVTDPSGAEDSDTVTVTVASDNVRASADAGSDQVVDEQTEVTLAGTGTDPDSDEITFSWKQIGGEAVELFDTESAEPTFTAPVVANGKFKILVFELQVADENGYPTKDISKVTILPVNMPPVVDAGEDQEVKIGDTISLAGTSSDEDDEPLTYLWNQISGPTVELSTSTELETSFVAPKTEVDAVITFQLIANDGSKDSEPDTVDVMVKGAPVKIITANAGNDQRVQENSKVTLFGSGKDQMKHNLSYNWRQIFGVQVELSANDVAKPSFTAPLVANGETKKLTFEITVSDGTGRSAMDTVKVTVDPINSAPTAIAKIKTVREAV
ncbi:MAG: PKD domain-containing protein [Candidatus Nitrosotenuis sp.]